MILIFLSFFTLSLTSLTTSSEPFYRMLRSIPKKEAYLGINYTWPIRRVTEIEGDLILGGLMMVHEREDKFTCGPIMPQGGIQALETMLYTIDYINNLDDFLPGIKIGAHVLDDCDKDTYGLEQAVDFIKAYLETKSLLFTLMFNPGVNKQLILCLYQTLFSCDKDILGVVVKKSSMKMGNNCFLEGGRRQQIQYYNRSVLTNMVGKYFSLNGGENACGKAMIFVTFDVKSNSDH
uniref:Receptor ligand binding region domain-containing protein n=1 Tax=Strigamia maritima TaxID=126957 RepID=T1JJH5_STRMM